MKSITSLGLVEEGALVQAQNCLRDAEAFCLMADNHKGYGMPVGGVAVYKDKISPAGVGFDIACFTADTKVALADGRSLSFADLIQEDIQGKENFVFSIDGANNVRIGKLESPRKTGIVDRLVVIELDNGEVIRCTLDHAFYTRDGGQIQAQYLTAGVSLMPLYLKPFGEVLSKERAFSLKKNKLSTYTSVYNPADSLYYLVHLLADQYNIDRKVYVDNSVQRNHAEHRKNHKVRSAQIIQLNEAIPVFCLTVPDYHNFALASGVFVHNCGNKAVKTNLTYSSVRSDLAEIADTIWRNLSFGVGLVNKKPFEHELFDSETWELDFYKTDQSIKTVARNQLGTIGSGNHYVDIFRDEDDTIWIGVHFGSRGLGHKTATHFMQLAGDNPNIMDETPHLLDVNSKDGQDYIQAMQLAGQYAYAGRDWVCATVAELLGAQIVEEIHNHHNFAWQETHNGQTYWVVRKGATPAFPGQYGFVGGSMMDNAVIIKGIDTDKSAELFYSTVHGAGRVMSRTKAAGKFKGWGKNRHQVARGVVNFTRVKEDVKAAGIELRGAGADEAPEVYKRLNEVLDAHAGTIEIVHTLRPLIVCMAGENEYDPYKD